MKTHAVLLLAAGKSSRFRDPHYKKPFVLLDQKAVWLHSAERFLNRPEVGQVVLVIAPEDREPFFSKFGPNVAILGLDIVTGGAQRGDSVRLGLEAVDASLPWVAVHDTARPCVTDELITRLFTAAQDAPAAILATPVADTIKEVENGQVIRTVPRDKKWLAQTPQVFRRDLLVQAFAAHAGEPHTDEAQLMERAGHHVAVVEGTPWNMKITTRQDLTLAKAVLKALPKPKLDLPAHPFADDDLWR